MWGLLGTSGDIGDCYSGELWPGASRLMTSAIVLPPGELWPGASHLTTSAIVLHPGELWPGALHPATSAAVLPPGELWPGASAIVTILPGTGLRR